MALTSSPNPISADQIRTEFGATSGTSVRFGDYRAVNQTVGTLTGLPLDTDVPQSGPIKFSDFYSKKLNIVVDCHSGSDETRVDARAKYDANQITIIGGFKTSAQKPSAGAGARIITNVNKLIGSEKTGRNYAALKTGQWGTDATMEIVIGSSGGIYGAGGDGGGGNGGNGGQGTTALAIQYPVTITNQGNIVAGRGGGGGGGIGNGYKHADTQRGCQGRQNCINAAGGGGGGGIGFPGGTGGGAGGAPGSCRGMHVGPQSGTSGNTSSNGNGGAGGRAGQGNCIGEAVGGNGGGAEGSGGGGGGGGSRGYAVIIDSTGSLISYTGNARDGETYTSAQVGSSL